MSADVKKPEAKAAAHAETAHHAPDEGAEAVASKPKRLISFSPYTIAAIVFLLLAVHVAMFYVRLTKMADAPKDAEPATELPLGKYHFASSNVGNAVVRSADFSVYVTLLRTDEKKARNILKTHELRIRQEIEQILRQSHGGDFSDPLLAGLKDTIKSQLNDLFGFKAIGSVIITDMSMTSGRSNGGESEENPRRYGHSESSSEEKNSSASR